MMVGIVSGTYSSIFIASPVLTAWKEREPGYARRRERIAELEGRVPAFADEIELAKLGDDAEPEGEVDGGRRRRPEPEAAAARRERWRPPSLRRRRRGAGAERSRTRPPRSAASATRAPPRAPPAAPQAREESMMALLVWFTMGIALWHFTVFLPDRFWQGIVGAFIGSVDRRDGLRRDRRRSRPARASATPTSAPR